MTHRIGYKRFAFRFLALMLAFLAALTMLPGGFLFPQKVQAAEAVTIKTQAAADSIKNGIRGIDVSKYQGTIDWSKVAKDDVQFAFIRASYGTTADPNFVTNANSAYKNGIKVGAYHYATFSDEESMKKEAAFFLSQLKRVNINYPVVLDLELTQGLSKTELTKLANQFLDIIANNGYKTLLYSYENFFRDYLDNSNLNQHEIWVANYKEKPTLVDHTMWQHTSYGSVDGIEGRVDINIAYKDLSPVILVDKDISDSILTYLNTDYGFDLSLEKFDSPKVNESIVTAIQQEINVVYPTAQIEVTSKMTALEISRLKKIDYTLPYTQLIRLLQCRLFYLGYYTEPISGTYDEYTQQVLLEFQSRNNLEQTGIFDEPTLAKMFGVKIK